MPNTNHTIAAATDNHRLSGKIESVDASMEDHGLWQCMVFVHYDNGIQGFGSAWSDRKDADSFAGSLCETFGVATLPELVGQQCHVLRCFVYNNASIEGLEAADGKRFTRTSWARKHYPNEKIHTPLELEWKRAQADIEFHERRALEKRVELDNLSANYRDWDYRDTIESLPRTP